MVANWLRRVGTVCCGLVAVGLLPGVAARAQAGDFYADLDRDGVRDVISIQPSSGLVVWLSGSKSVLKLPTHRPIMRVTAADIDGDGRIELVASDTAARLHVWHQTRGGKLRPTRPRHVPVSPGLTSNRRVHQAPDDASTAAIDEGPAAPPSDAPHPARLPSLDVFGHILALPRIAFRSLDVVPHQPRAPPGI